MRVIDTFEVRGRGVVARVEDLPPVGGLKVGMLVHQGDHAWRIVACEMVEPPDGRVGLVLLPLADAPLAPQKGELDL